MQRQIWAAASWLLRRRWRRGQTVAVLAGNGIEHAIIMPTCMHVGIPYAPLPKTYVRTAAATGMPARMLQSLSAGVLFCDDPTYLPQCGFDPVGVGDTTLVMATAADMPTRAQPFQTLLAQVDGGAVARAYAATGPDTLAKILFTSGSTSEPKGVLTTQRMLCASQQARTACWPFLRWSGPRRSRSTGCPGATPTAATTIC
ncbi:MAG: AMP-binding protein [Candidatus Protistobacter heckmanni]|nr:AMP-binding protein [Candidatus Protistobacter heckmanni]